MEGMIKKYSGKVEVLDNEYRVEQGKEGRIWIGEIDIVDDLHETQFNGPVTVGIQDERWDGLLSVETGWGYSEYTPMDSDHLSVGTHDLLDILERYKDQEITLFIADEPVNILE